MRMIPSLVVKAQDEWILPPTKYRLSKTLAGSAYQVSRAGALAGFATYAGSTSLESSPPLWGRRQTRTSVPRNSKPAAVFADCTAAWASASKSLLAGACASALHTTNPLATSAARENRATCFFISNLLSGKAPASRATPGSARRPPGCSCPSSACASCRGCSRSAGRGSRPYHPRDSQLTPEEFESNPASRIKPRAKSATTARPAGTAARRGSCRDRRCRRWRRSRWSCSRSKRFPRPEHPEDREAGHRRQDVLEGMAADQISAEGEEFPVVELGNLRKRVPAERREEQPAARVSGAKQDNDQRDGKQSNQLNPEVKPQVAESAPVKHAGEPQQQHRNEKNTRKPRAQVLGDDGNEQAHEGDRDGQPVPDERRVLGVPMVIARPHAHENHAGEEHDPGRLAASQFVPQTKPQPRDSGQKKRDSGDDVPEVRNSEKSAPVGEFMIVGILTDRRGREHQRHGPDRDDREQ